MKKIVCLSFDVEGFDPPVIFGVPSEYSMSNEFSVEGCRLLADLFGRLGVSSTFFVTGMFARERPEVVRELVSLGHDVGCHGNEHRPLWKLSYDELKGDIEAGKNSVEKASGSKVLGFRSPRNMVNPHLYEVLSELSFRYDSSVHPALIPGRWLDVLKKRGVHTVNGIVEVPSSTMLGLPISWWWMRNIGLWYTKLGCEVSLKLESYALLYFHAWEFTDAPEVLGVPKHMTRGVGGKFLRNLEKLVTALKDRGYGFGTIPDIIKSRTR
jgi:peptidoglycan/xylan/chitin deacetylase (PgdA/CDA1 family)